MSFYFILKVIILGVLRVLTKTNLGRSKNF